MRSITLHTPRNALVRLFDGADRLIHELRSDIPAQAGESEETRRESGRDGVGSEIEELHPWRPSGWLNDERELGGKGEDPTRSGILGGRDASI